MKEKFSEFYVGKDKLWKDAVFIFDTNTVLDILRLPKTESDTFLKVLKELKKQNKIWLPYQVCEEYHNHYQSILKEKELAVDAAKKNLRKEFEVIFGKTEQDNNDGDKNEKEPYKSFLLLQELLKNAEKMKPDSEKLYDDIDNIFSEIGDDYDAEIKKQKISDAEKRIKECIPPGYKDNGKNNGNETGDIIVWFEIMDYAKANNKDVVFVTNDTKEDWFQKLGKLTVMPRPELIREFHNKTGKNIWIYTEENFIKEYNKNKNIPEEAKLTEKEETQLIKFMTVPQVRPGRLSLQRIPSRKKQIPYREHVEEMKEWFLQNYEDPQLHCPYDEEEEEYMYLNGGPFEANEVLSDEFGHIYSDEAIRIAVDELETENDVLEWAKKDSDDFAK